ncbi:mammalian cell entry protein [Mycolicibacterium fortuitum]|nr:MlaD family protein [Mycolicibacterium fortuitum]OMC07278.1 mammalian cell entry protein [Mycolicibacterium fortuitum]
MRVRDLVSFICFGVMVAFGVSYIGALGVRVGLPSDRTDLSMSVADVNGLAVGSKVLLRGVQIGRVSHITSSVDAATVDFYIVDKFQIPVDSDIRLENLSALGESYISLVPRSVGGATLTNGQHIETQVITQPPSISELATSVVRVLDQLDPAALQRITAEVDTALPDANSVLPNLSRTSRLLRNTAADMNGRGSELLDNFQTLLANADWVGPVLANLTFQINDYSPKLRELFSTFPPLIAVGAPEPLVKFNAFLARIQKLLDDNGGDFGVIGDNFLPHMKGIAGSLMNFDTGQMLANVMASVPEDGAVTLHVQIPGN